MDFDWDAANTGHIALHNITRAEAEEVAQDSGLLSGSWQIRNGKWRLDMIGRAGGRVLQVVITTRDPLVRVVTARAANCKERRMYRERRR
ncbi:MAG TPA: BrnT family toxin [Dehalococcoidia bacterium]|nr:BrnT family toxin [Dehalococcoidia bacterium]